MKNPLQTNKALYNKYSSSQTYYYSNVIGQIVKEKRTKVNINYQDMEYLSDNEQYLKRFYQHHQYPGKMITFKQYYFYHQDCPRIFMKYIQDLYSKWQDRKRDLVYKKLKILYNQSFSSSRSSTKDDQKRSASGVTNFLLQISQYNFFSKKYYLRVQAKRQQQQKKRMLKQSQQQKNKSIRDISSLNHQLSIMLNDMGELSIISTFQKRQSPRLSTLYHPKKLKINYSSEYSTHHNSQSNSNIHSSVKFNFKKQRQSKQINNTEQTKQLKQLKDKQTYNQKVLNQQVRKKIELKEKSRQEKYTNLPSRLSPKFAQKPLTNDQFSKSKSIYQLSSMNSNNNKKSQVLINIHPNKKQSNLKLKSDKKPSSRQNKMNFDNKQLKKYDSQKKMILTHANNSKTKRVSVFANSQQRLDVQSLNKKNSYNISSHVQLKALPRNQSLKDPLLKITYGKQFSDNKLNNNQDIRFRSHKSQYASLNKQSLLTRENSPLKAGFKIHQKINDKKIVNKQKLNIQNNNRKAHQLKLQ